MRFDHSSSVNGQMELNASLLNMVERDMLTGLYNREAFFENARRMIAQQKPGYYVISCFDIDHFKVINDQYGIAKGDEVLRRIAKIFRDAFGKLGGLCCRISGDSFAVLYPCRYMDAKEISGLHEAVKQLDSSMQPITFSVGRYIIDDLTLPVSAMYDRAAIAEKSIKGRFDVHTALYDESMREKILQEQELIGEMDRALAGRQFELWLQPQYNHATGALLGAEVLVRWRHPVKGVIPPGIFVPTFERNGFIYELDKYIWEQACILLKKWLNAGQQPLPISVNVSRHDVLRADFFEVLTGYVESYHIPVELLRLEITESAFVTGGEMVITVVKQLVDYGFTIEIDDFGSGYSSLNILKDVPADILKLDMRFLESNENSRRGGNIVESVIRMAKWLGMPVIAEGVETKEQADYLKSIGCSYVQGYLYAKPMPTGEFEQIATGANKQSDMVVLETVEALDNNAFWDPKSMETLIFNSYVGGACIFEYHRKRIELLRANDKYAHALGGRRLSVESALTVSWAEHMDADQWNKLAKAMRRAITTKDEVAAEMIMSDVCGHAGNLYLRLVLRVIATAGDRYLFYCTVDNITQQREAERAIMEMSEQVQFLNEISKSLLADGDLDAGIHDVLARIMHYFDGNRAYVFELDYERQVTNNTYEVCAPGVSAEIGNLQNISFATISLWLDAFENNSHVRIASVDMLGKSRSAERRILAQQNIDSLVAVPLRMDGRLIGFIGVDDPQQKLSHIDHLEALGDFVAVLLARKMLNARIESDSATLTALMNDTPGGFMRAQVHADGSGVAQYVNKSFCKMLGMTQEEIMSHYSIDSMWNVHPDDKDAVREAAREMCVSNDTRQMQYRLRCKDGQYKRFLVFGRATANERGEVFLNVYFTDAPEPPIPRSALING